MTIKRHIRALENHEGGGSQPQVLGADDGSEWMVKAKNNPQGIRVLVNELVGTALAARLYGAVRPFAVCTISPEVASAVRFSTGQTWEAGQAFGSELIDGGNPVAPAMLDQSTNAEGLLVITAVDTWLVAHDSRQALAVAHPQGGYTIVAVDFGHTIGGPAWTAQDLVSRADPVTLSDGNGWATRRSPGMAERVAEALESVTDEEIAGIIAQVPSDWGLSQDESVALQAYLSRRRQTVANLLRRLESKEGAA